MFAGLSDTDFEAYAPAKWKSNVYNRERLEVKQKLLALAKDLSPHLTGDDQAPLAAAASVEHPALWNHKQVESQHLFFFRSEGARKELDHIIERGQSLASKIDDPTPQRNHLFLSLTVAHDRVDAALKLHPDARVDRQNLERKCEDHFEREKLLHLLGALPDGYQFGLSTAPLASVRELSDERLLEALSGFAAPSPPPPTMSLTFPPARFLLFSRALPRPHVVSTGAAFADEARASLTALLPLYRFIAWSRDNDYVSMRDVLQKEKQAKRQKGLAKNDEVQVVRGILTGQMGVVQEIDARGSLKILVGKLAIKVDAADVIKR